MWTMLKTRMETKTITGAERSNRKDTYLASMLRRMRIPSRVGPEHHPGLPLQARVEERQSLSK
jgi:hypothetical protein